MRYLLIAENPGFSVSHKEELLRRLRAVLPVIAVRIATGHVEVDVKTDDLEKAVAEVEKVVGRVLEVVDITFEDVGGGVERYVDLFNRERFLGGSQRLGGSLEED